MKLKTLLLVSLIAYWGFLLLMTHMPHPPSINNYSDKTLHMGAYGALALLLSLNFQFRKMPAERIIARTVVIILFAGALDEWTQPFFGRACELADWSADVSAAAAVSTGVAMIASLFK